MEKQEYKMKKLLATTAIALVAMASTASAQSVLERVLGQIDNSTNLASVNGTFANIAENIGGSVVLDQDRLSPNDQVLLGYVQLTNTDSVVIDGVTYADGDPIFATAGNTGIDPFTGNTATLTPDVTATVTEVNITSDVAGNNNARQVLTFTSAGTTSVSQSTAGSGIAGFDLELGTALYAGPGVVTFQTALNGETLDFAFNTIGTGGGIDGSITNVIDGIDAVTQTAIAGTVSAIEYNMPTFDFGDMATTALGAVNTGDITLGVNSSVDNAKTTSTEAVSSVMEQLGGSADTGAIVLNIASNMTGVNGSINNAMMEVNGSIGNLSTTALGAVNTGTIISGVNAAVTGITGASAGQ